MDLLWDFTIKAVPKIHDPCISRLQLGTKNHEMYLSSFKRQENEYLRLLFTEAMIVKMTSPTLCRIRESWMAWMAM